MSHAACWCITLLCRLFKGAEVLITPWINRFFFFPLCTLICSNVPEIFGHGAGVALCYYSCCQHSSSQTHTGWSEVFIYWNNVFKIAEGAQPGALLLLLHVCFCKSGSSQWLCAATLIHDSPPAVRDHFTPFPNISCVAIETLIPVS